MLSTIVTFLVKIGLGSIVEQTIDLMKYKASLEVDKEKLRTEVSIAHLQALVEETRIMADFNKEKLQHKIFWLLVLGFAGGLCIWWNAVLLDSIFNFSWSVANLPTPEMRQWAGDMIKWIFYVGSGVAAIKMVGR